MRIVKHTMNHLFSVVTSCVVIGNLAFWIVPLTLFAIAKALSPTAALRHGCHQVLVWIYRAAAAIDSWWMVRVVGIRIEVEGELPDHPSPVLICNHQTWFDIPVLQHVVTGQGPIIKFLIKRELVWVPIVGWICYALNFPRLRRGQGADARQQDYSAVQAFSNSLSVEDGALLIFAEGTRFTEEKQQRLESPYRHLLPPKPGGLKIALETAPPGTPVVDITIIYHGDTNFWRCLAGASSRITVKMNTTHVEEISDTRAWLEETWRAKDLDF